MGGTLRAWGENGKRLRLESCGDWVKKDWICHIKIGFRFHPAGIWEPLLLMTSSV